MGAIIGAVATVFSVAVSVMSMQDEGPNMGSPPPPANYYRYDEEGNLTSSQVWDADKNAFTYRENPEPEKPQVSTKGLSLTTDNEDGRNMTDSTGVSEDRQTWIRAEQEVLADRNNQWGPIENWDNWQRSQYQTLVSERREEIYQEMLYKKAEQSPEYQAKLKDWEVKHAEWQKGVDARKEEKRLRTEIRTKVLGNLNQTPEDRVAAYEQYAKTFSESMQKGVTEQYEKAKQSQEEKMSATGMYGSRAYTDTMGEMAKEKLKADVNIAEKGEMAKHELGNVDRNYWLNALNSLDAGARADAVVGMQKAQAANQAALGGTATLMGRYAADSQNQWNKWNAEQARNMGMVNTVNNTAGGLMYLYGYGGRGGSIAPSRYSSLDTTLPTGGLSYYNY